MKVAIDEFFAERLLDLAEVGYIESDFDKSVYDQFKLDEKEMITATAYNAHWTKIVLAKIEKAKKK